MLRAAFHWLSEQPARQARDTYLMRRLAERPANVAFIVGNVLKESVRGRAR